MTTPRDPARSRREFLATSAAAAGMAAFVANRSANAAIQPATSAGKAAARVPLKDGEPIRMAVIGPGGMGTGHCEAFATRMNSRGAKVQIVALADPWPRNLDRAHRALTGGTDKEGKPVEGWQKGVEVAKYADHKELLKDKSIHAVLIASPEHWHAQHAIDAILAGKDVYCEKPMTLHLEEALRLHATAQANPDIILQVGTQKMALPAYHEARKWIKEGLIGTPTCSQTSYCRNTPKGEWNYYEVNENWKAGKDVDWEMWCGPLGKTEFSPKLLNRWRRYRKTSTGIIGDLLVHVITPLMMAVDQGWPVRVTASGSHMVDKDMENHDTLELIAQFETGHQMVVIGATTNDTGLTPMIRGTKGNIEVTESSLRFTPQRPYAEINGEPVEERKPQLPNIGDDQDQHRYNWLQCIRSRQQPESNTEAGVKCLVIVDLATRSLWEGGTWTFDPKTMQAKRS